jgi:endogenous inhibitor of DNA gyrase (YacG/DUF329 family)
MRMLSAHDRHLAQYSCSVMEAECPNCEREFEVLVEREYGQSWCTPEECPECHTDVDWDSLDDFEPDPPEREDDDRDH